MQSPRAFDHPAFQRYQAGRLCAVLGVQTLSVSIGWLVYARTGRAIDLGYVGLVQFLPGLFLFPITGAIVDRWSRKAVLVLVYLGLAIVAAALAFAAWKEAPVGVLFGIITAMAVLRAFSAPAGPASIALTVPGEALSNALAWNSATWSIGSVVGPALAGAVYGATGSAAAAFAFGAALLLVAVVAFASTRLRTPERASRDEPVLASMTQGVRFIFRTPILLAAVSLDLFAVLFGGAVALLPIYARDRLAGGPELLGALRASPALGAVTMALVLTRVPLRRRVGVTLLATVTVFGLATLGFAFSRTAVVAMAALFVVGASDEISVFIRQQLVQLSTPESMRGRVSAAEFVFIGASNELGEMESGFAASRLGAVGAAVLGGVGALVTVAVTAVVADRLRRLDTFADVDAGQTP